LLAGRKLLLADDSATIQKVIDLTFADEGVQVLAVSNGQEASISSWTLTRYSSRRRFHAVSQRLRSLRIRQNKREAETHPVMLLVGSFEPFDEAEARRVGADDILTKPFSSIRRLIDRWERS
jgi:CheY-like chemotaxis protein